MVPCILLALLLHTTNRKYYMAYWFVLVPHTHSFNGLFSGTTLVSQYQKGKTNLDFTEARDSEWQWHQLGTYHMQVSMYKSPTRSRRITVPAPHHSVFYRLDALPAAQPTASKHWRNSSSASSNDLEWPWRSFACSRPYQMQFYEHLYDISHGFNWHGASRGPSAIAELLVKIFCMAVTSQGLWTRFPVVFWISCTSRQRLQVDLYRKSKVYTAKQITRKESK